MENTWQKPNEKQKRYNEDFDKKLRFRIKLQSEDQIYIESQPRRKQGPQSGVRDSLVGLSDKLEETATEGSRRMILRTTNPNTVKSVTENTVTPDKDGSPSP